MKLILFCLAFLAACSGATGPQGLDPTVRLANSAGPDTLRMTWFDQSGQVATFLVAPGTSACAHFTATRIADSVRFVAVMGDTSGTPGVQWAKQQSPWFNPATGIGPDPTQYPFGAEFWTVDVPQPFTLILQAVQVAPC
jgi:hypothetical protein